MTPALAFAATVAVVAGLGALRLGPPPTRAGRLPSRTVSAPHAAPAWLMDAVALLGIDAQPSLAWNGLRWALPAGAAALLLATGPAATAVVCALALAGPRAARPALTRRRRLQVDAQLPAALERLASALRAGAAPGPAFVELAAVSPEPLAAELRAPALEVEHGAGLADAIDRWAARPGASPAVRLTGAALGLGVEAGGEVARSVDRLAGTLRERREVQAEASSLATQARASAGVLALAPVGFTALVATIEPDTARFLVTNPLGLLCLALGIALEAAGIAWMARITGRAM